MIYRYIWILKWIYHRWDRFFSRIDDWQLHKWLKLRNYIEKLEWEHRS